MDYTQQLAALARTLKQLLLASYGLYPDDIERELARAVTHLGGEELVLLLADYDQRVLVGFGADDDRTHDIDAPGPGDAFRWERVVEEQLGGGRRRLWIPAKDSADRIGVIGVVDGGSVALDHWEAVGSLTGELLVSKAHYGDHITLRKRSASFSLAAEMRWALLPPLTFPSPDVSIAGFLQPSHGIAGDAFDYAVTGRTAHLAILDAMGHGLEASRMANVAIASYRSSRRAGLDPAAMLGALDEVIRTEFGDSRFVTAQAATLDLDSGRMQIANAGHPQPMMLSRKAAPSRIDCPASRAAGLDGPPSVTDLQLRPGETVLFITDGITDARSPAGEHFGDERLAELVAELIDAGESPAEVLRQAVRTVIDHQDGRPGDDATLLAATWRGRDQTED